MKKITSFIFLFIILLSIAGCTNANNQSSENVSSSSNNTSNNSNQISSEQLSKTWLKDVKLPYNFQNFPNKITATPIVSSENRIYYVTTSGIIKISTDYSQTEQIVASAEIDKLYLHQNVLYYNTPNKIYKYNEATKQSELILELSEDNAEQKEFGFMDYLWDFWIENNTLKLRPSAATMVDIDLFTKKHKIILNDYMFYADTGDFCFYTLWSSQLCSIHKMNNATGETKKVRGDNRDRYDDLKERYDGLAAIGNELYFTMRGPKEGLFKYSDTGNDEAIVLLENENDYMIMGQNINNEKFYYTVRTDNKYTIYEYTKTGSKIVLTTDNLFGYFVADKYLFYKETEESNYKMRIIS